ncbi:MOSC domain-containing protein [Mucilaginibacter glaciei]|uniref:MOSC domain-containing protein n=1 Tax=Mucilaginibacter glaciei TaxID=2772109 RepID=A0A926NMF7_9SPHI|nr:MOSC N-terminal beta barrel domain-containing protein [Mucilaginibacter glaciei]MBD1391908.1 MOSC domain-containing protein [Mucilaginibacter glaciei]
MLQISQLFIYPIKSLGGIELKTSAVTDRGLEYDRRWMLIDDNNRFLSQRENAQMALFKTAIGVNGLKVTYSLDLSSITFPFIPLNRKTTPVVIWDDICTGQYVSEGADAWFTLKLGINCRLVYMADDSLRPTDLRYTKEGTVTSFSDGYPLLMIGQASLDDLNSRLKEALPMNRFRPNIVFTGGEPYSEDTFKHLTINGIDIYGVKLCARCVMTTIDQDTMAKGKEPLKTLAGYRRKGAKILFGQNIVSAGAGTLNVGDEIQVQSLQTEERFIFS